MHAPGLLASPTAILRRMARPKRPQPIDKAASALLTSLLAAENPDHVLIEAGHALVDALAEAGMLDGTPMQWHEALSMKRSIAGSQATLPSTPAPQAKADAAPTLDARRAMLDAMLGKLAASGLTAEEAFRTRMTVMTLESAGAIDSSTADALLREVPAGGSLPTAN